MIEYYSVGIAILAGAIIVNMFAHMLKLYTWYDFFIKIRKFGAKKALKKTSFLNYLFLFIIYPFLLGLIAVTVQKLIS